MTRATPSGLKFAMMLGCSGWSWRTAQLFGKDWSPDTAFIVPFPWETRSHTGDGGKAEGFAVAMEDGMGERC